MLAANRDTPDRSDIRRPPPCPKAPRCDLSHDIDLERLVWDQEYREEVRLALKSGTE